MRINFINWRPDQDELNTDGLQVAENVLHDFEGYKETRGPATASTLANTSLDAAFLAADVLGDGTDGFGNAAYIAALHDTTGNLFYLGTYDTWAEYVATPPAGATAGGLISFSTTELEDKIVACTKFYFSTASGTGTTTASGYISYSLQYGVGSSWNTITSVSGLVCGTINNFAMIGNLGAGNPNRHTVRWSAVGDATSWPTPATSTARSVQAGQEVLDAAFGEVTAVAGNDFYGYVFQTTGITKFTYVGGDVVFTVDTFEKVRGCGFYDRVVAVDDAFFFESRCGRHMLENDVIVDIGRGWVDDAFPVDTDTAVRIHKNPKISTVFFSNGCCYNYKTKQWTRVPGITPIVDIENATGIIGQWMLSGGQTLLVDSTGGAKLASTVTTGDADLNEGARTYIDGVRPLIDGGTWNVRVGSRDNLTTTISWSTAVAVTARTGMHDFREEGRYQRFEFTNSDGFTTALGADIDAKPAGEV